VAEIKNLPDFPQGALMFITSGIYWGSLSGRTDARTGAPERPSVALHVPSGQ